MVTTPHRGDPAVMDQPQTTKSHETTTWLRSFIDKAGARVTVRSFRHQDLKSLLEMYYQFEPKQMAQRLPPRTEEQINRWIECLNRDGDNLVAVVGRHVVGHSVLCNLQDGRAELAIFVHQDFQNRGIGTHMIHLVRRAAILTGYFQIWLSVESSNLQAIRVFLKNGFQFTGNFDNESEMILDLTLVGGRKQR